MLTKDALELILQHNTCQIDLVHEHGLQAPVTRAPNGVKLVELEKYLPAPVRHRALFNTDHIESFADYCQANGQDLIVFASSDRLQASVVFDIGTPDKPSHNEQVAKIITPWSEEWQAVCELGVTTIRRTQKEAAESIEEWRDFLTPINAEQQPISLAEAIAAIRDLETHARRQYTSTEHDLKQGRTAMEEIEVSQRSGVLPWGLRFDVSPADGVEKITRLLRMNVITGEKPMITFREMRPDQSRKTAIQAYMLQISKALQKREVSHQLLIGALQ